MTSYLPCFGKHSTPSTRDHADIEQDERDPLLPQTNPKKYASVRNMQPKAQPILERSRPAPSPTFDDLTSKFIDCLAALNAGKLPSQGQLDKILRWVLTSEILEVEPHDPATERLPHKERHTLGREATEFVASLRGVTEALLQFGMEKNDDDKIQDIWAEIANFDTTPSPHTNVSDTLFASSEPSTSTAPSSRASSREPRRRKSSNPPLQSTSDVQTFLFSMNTLIHTFMASHPLRGALADFSDLLREATVHTAQDLQKTAEDVQEVAQRDLGGEHAEERVEDVLKAAKEGVQEFAGEVKEDWGRLGGEVEGAIRQKSLTRIQKILEQVQRNSASRSAMRSILILGKKYAQDIIEEAEKAQATAEQHINETGSDDTLKSVPNYPPDPYGLERASAGSDHLFPQSNPTIEPVLGDVKGMAERIAGNHSLNPLLEALESVLTDLCVVPVVVAEDMAERVEGKAGEAAADAVKKPVEDEGAEGQVGKKKKKKKKGKKKANASISMTASNSSLAPSPLSPSPSQASHTTQGGEDEGEEEPDERGKGKEEKGKEKADEKRSETPTTNPLREYFSRLDAFLDKTLDESGWIRTQPARDELSCLFDDGVRLLHAVEDSVSEVESEVAEDVKEGTTGTHVGSSKQPQQSQPRPGSTPSRIRDEAMRKQFRQRLHALLHEYEQYVHAIEQDRTTMRLIRAVTQLESAFMSLVRHGEGLKNRLRRWTNWIGWIVPRLLRSLPNEILPIPSVEIKNGNIEGGLYALFVKALKRGEEPIETKLCPDQVIVREWTEVRVDMARRSAEEQALMHQLGLTHGSFPSPENPIVETVSRIKLHLDGVRARIENMGYFFRYSGDWIGYEDEGVVNVDLGRMGIPHDGFSMDIEVEMDAGNEQTNIPTIIVEGEAEETANLDVQRAVAGPGEMVGTARTLYSNLNAPAEPLFKVVNVQVEMHGVKVQMEKTRHWLLNTYVVQPLAGPVLARVIREAIEGKMRDVLERLSKNLGEVAKEAKRRREKRRGLRAADEVNQPGKSEQKGETHDSLVERLGDWWLAFLRAAPRMTSGTEDSKETSSRTILTGKGIVHAVRSPDASSAPTECEFGREVEGSIEETETLVAVGVDAQLYPGKGDPEAGEVGTRPSLDELQQRMQDHWSRQTSTMKSGGRGKKSWFSSAFEI